jgi:anthranilate 1,2-dioxygenase small subunit
VSERGSAMAEAERAIAELFDAYNECIDHEEYERWPELFLAKCVYQIISAEDLAAGRPSGFVYCDSRDMLLDRVRTMRTVNVYEPHRYRHLTGRSAVTSEAGYYRVRTSYMVARISMEGDTDLFSTGEYRDEVVVESNRALFRKRIVVCDSRRISNLLALPI